MFELSPAEFVGYAASVLVVVSLAMTSVLKLRILNLAGAVAFLAYGALIGSVPILLTNVAIVALNLVFLARTARTKTFFRVLAVQPDSAFVAEFLRFYGDDIARFHPDFTGVAPGDSVVWLLRDAVTVGILVGRRRDGAFEVDLDYMTRQYRDFKAGRWLFGPGSNHFTDQGLRRIEAKAETREYRRYLTRMGFKFENGLYVRYLD